MFHIALYQPQIAPNTGNILRLIANNGCYLHLIEPLGFDLEDKKLRRAGLDYSDLDRVSRHKDYSSFLQAVIGRRIFPVTTKGDSPPDQIVFNGGDVLLFGSETAGLPDDVLESFAPSLRIRIPMQPNSRSLNLSNAVAIVSYEAWRQLGYKGKL